MATGIDDIIKDNNDEPIADLFIIDVFDVPTKKITGRILVIFNQVGDKIVFLYKKDKFDVISIADNIIRLKRNGIDYAIERIPTPI